MFKLKNFIFLPMALAFSIAIHAQNIKSMEFNLQKKTDILMVLAKENHISVIPDETVTGETSFHFEDMSAKTALDTFLKTEGLYSVFKDGVLYVSAVYADYDDENSTVSVFAKDAPAKAVIEKIADAANVTILKDPLPDLHISLNINRQGIKEALETCIRQLEDFSLEKNNSYFYIKKSSSKESTYSRARLTKEGSLYFCDIENATVFNMLSQLFENEKKQYVLFAHNDSQLSNIHVAEKTFDELLELFMNASSTTCINKDGVYYILDGVKKDKNDALKSIVTIPLSNISAQDFSSLIPSAVSSSIDFRIDKNANAIILWAGQKEADEIKNLIAVFDCETPLVKKIIQLKNIEAQNALSLIPPEMILGSSSVLENQNAIAVTTTQSLLKKLEDYVLQIDVPLKATAVNLRYIKKDELFQKLPPSVKPEWISDSGYPNLIFYKGPSKCLENFLSELSLIDRPQPQIRYQLLVVQYNEGKGSSFHNAVSVQKINDEKSFAFSGELSNITNLAFNVIDSLGWQFASSLNMQLSQNKAHIFTDTSLTSISGQEVKFQNTDTYRYLEYEYDTASGLTTASGVTQQITSGLIVSLTGWISGGNMITMDINATVSKQNGETSSSSIPSTSERIVSTQVRCENGKSTIISGLIKEDETVTKTPIPILGHIPLLGRLFTTTTKSKEKSEIEIYIIPHLVKDETHEFLTSEDLCRIFLPDSNNSGKI